MNSDACSLIVKIIELVSINNCDVKEVTNFGMECFAVQFSKKGAVELFHCLYANLGNSIKPLLNSETLKELENDFKSIKPLTL